MAKTLSERVVTGARGVNVIERLVLEMGCAWHPTSGSLDTGVDGYIDICDPVTHASTNHIVQVQSRATLGKFAGETEHGFHYLCDENDLEHWMSGNAPLIFVRVRPPDEAYWIPIKDYFRAPDVRKSRRIVFDKQRDRLTSGSREALIALAVPRKHSLVFARERRPETIVSNLLPVARVAQKVFVARTDMRKPWQVFEAFKAKIESSKYPLDWILDDKSIYSFGDLNTPLWGEIIEDGTCETHDTVYFAKSTDENIANQFSYLLTKALFEATKANLDWDDGHDVLYFRATPDLMPREIDYPGRTRICDRTVFKGYGEKKDGSGPSYYRHSAFSWRYRRLGGDWFLEVTPSYHYTADGVRPYAFYGERLKVMRRLERNAAVLGQLMMWKHVISPTPSQQSDLFNTSIQRQQPIVFGDWVSLPVDCGVPDDAWLPQEENPSDIVDVDVDADEASFSTDEDDTPEFEFDP